jgi:Domain of unknown function (DUF4386)
MSTTVVMNRMAVASPRFRARVAGVFEALEGLTSAYGQVVVLGRLVVFASAATTASNILGHERLFWLGFASSLIGVACHIVWVLLFYELFKPVNRSLSLLAAFVGLVVCGLQALTALLYLAPFLVLTGGNSVSAFTMEQLQALTMIFLRLNAYAFNVDLVLFGLWCILTGYLISRSRFLPRILGVLLAIDGLGWAMYVYPPLAFHLFPFIAGASALAEFPLQLWLLVMGVNSQRWNEQARAAEESCSYR